MSKALEYKDALGIDIKVGDHLVYAATDGALRLGRVLELRETVTHDRYAGTKTSYPSIRIQGAWRMSYGPDQGKYVKLKPSVLSKLDNVVVLSQNLVVQLSLL